MTDTFDSARLSALTLKWADMIRALPLSWNSGIYPAEMAVFLGLCELRGVRTIIESGRGPDAYSTHIIGSYAEKTGTKAISVDFSSIDAHHYGSQLKSYTALRCESGDAFTVLPKLCADAEYPIGLLIDGPKAFQANLLSFGLASSYDIAVVAHHNCEPPSPWWDEFSTVYQGAFHYEDLPLASTDAWNEFRSWEADYVGHYENRDEKHALPGRDLAVSSLSLAILVPERSADILRRIPSFLRRLRVRLLRLRWKLLS